MTPAKLYSKQAGALLAVGLSALALAACGGSDSEADSGSPTGSGSSSSSSQGSNDQDTARVRLTQCLRENGVDVPDNVGQGDPPPADIDQEKLREALDGPCKELQDEAFGDITEEDRQEQQDRFQAFAQCMRENGVDVPDITLGDGPPAGDGQLDQDDPEVQAATEKCQDERPQGGPGQ